MIWAKFARVEPSFVSWQSEVFRLWHTCKHFRTSASVDLLQTDVVVCQLRDVRHDTVVVFDEVLVGLPFKVWIGKNSGTRRNHSFKSVIRVLSVHSQHLSAMSCLVIWWMEVNRLGHRFTLTLLMHSYRSRFHMRPKFGWLKFGKIRNRYPGVQCHIVCVLVVTVSYSSSPQRWMNMARIMQAPSL